jgi:hypothetical protein
MLLTGDKIFTTSSHGYAVVTYSHHVAEEMREEIPIRRDCINEAGSVR